MSPFTKHNDGSCRGVLNQFEWLDDAAGGACQRRCWETNEETNDDPSVLVGRCVAYSVSTAPHEERMCSMWDALSFRGPDGDGQMSRSCAMVEPSLVHDGVTPHVHDENFQAYRARMAARDGQVSAWRLGVASPAPPPDRWLYGHHGRPSALDGWTPESLR